MIKEIVKLNGYNYDPDNEVELKEFDKIFKNHKLYKKYDTELVWEEIRSIIKGSKPLINVSRYKTDLIHFLERSITGKAFIEFKEYLYGLKRFELINKIERIIEKKTDYGSYDRFIQQIQIKNPIEDQAVFILKEILNILDKKSKNFAEPLLSSICIS